MFSIIPRGRVDINLLDLLAGLSGCFLPDPRLTKFEAGSWEKSLVPALSVRSALDLYLQQLDLPPGSHVVISAVTIPDMAKILRQHDLVPRPVDLQPGNLGPKPEQLKQTITPQTRLILVAHLFGSRCNLDPVAKIAREEDILLIEDLAQAYDGRSLNGHTEADVSLFSFGPIKTATALGGAVMSVKDEKLADKLLEKQTNLKPQRRLQFAKQLLKFLVLKVLERPSAFGAFARFCRWLNTTHEEVIVRATRGFPGTESVERFRKRPCGPLLRLLSRRLSQDHRDRLKRRKDYARAVMEEFPKERFPGSEADDHQHWVLPFRSSKPDELVDELWSTGFDATRRGSSLEVIDPADNGTWPDLSDARQMLEELIYLPMRPEMSEATRGKMVRVIHDKESL